MILNKRILLKYLLNKIKYDLPVVLLVGLVTNFLAFKFSNFLPDMPLSIPAFLGTAISILLSFKINQLYDRWWEARKVWGAIVNDSRSLVIQLPSFLDDNQTGEIKKMAYRQIAWCYALGRSLRGLNPLEGADKFISLPENTQISNQLNKPLALLQLHAKDLKELRLNNKLETLTHLQLDNTLTRLCDAMGKAERINSTVFPSTYRKFLHLIIYLFVGTLAIAF
jgi:ion channel-forming bestrophin family protein